MNINRQMLTKVLRGLLVGCVFIFLGAVCQENNALAQVTESWVSRYNGPGNARDTASALAVDAAGDVYVTGYSVGSSTVLDYATVKYDANGNQLWVSRYNGPGNASDFALALAVDTAGNVYVTGQSQGIGTSFDYATVKYDTNGNQLWVSRYNGPANTGDHAVAIAVDGTGNVYVTGHSTGTGTSFDYATVKYDTNGAQLWVSRYNGPANNWDLPKDLVVDAAGNIHVTGGSKGVGAFFDYATVKYDTNGNQLWVSRYNGPSVNAPDVANDLTVDVAGNVYVTGESKGTGTSFDYATVKYDMNGNELWVSRYNGSSANTTNVAKALGVDATGNVYVTGYSPGIGTGNDYATVKYDANGTQLWVSRYNGTGNSTDFAWALGVDTAGNAYVTGLSTGTDFRTDYATVKYDTNGVQLWAARYRGPGNPGDSAQALALDATGNVYATGYSTGIGSEFDYATVKYSQGQNNQGPTPVSDAIVTQLTYIGQPLVSLDGSGSSDPNDPIGSLTFQWSVDGVPVCEGSVTTCGTLKELMAFGLHSITLRVTDPQGGFDEVTKTVTLDPALLSLLDITKARVKFSAIPNEIELIGDIGLPIGVNFSELSPEATAAISVAGAEILPIPAFSTIFQVLVDNPEEWAFSTPAVYGITKFDIDWKGAGFHFIQDGYPLELRSHLLTSIETILSFRFSPSEAGGPFVLTLGGVVFNVDTAGMVSTTATDVLVVVEEAGREVTLTLPFPLLTTTDIGVSGSPAMNRIIPVDSSTMTASTGRYRIRANFDGTPFPTGAATLPRELGLTITVGGQHYPGTTSLAPIDGLVPKDTEWRK